MVVSKELKHANKLFRQERFEEALEEVQRLEKEGIITPDQELKCRLLKTAILNKLGDYKDSLKLAEQILKETQEQENPLQIIDACIAIADALDSLGRWQDSLETVEKGEQILVRLVEDQPESSASALARRKSSLLHYKGLYFRWKGELDKALNCFEQSLALRKEFDDKPSIVLSLNWLGIIRYGKGELNLALAYLEKSLAISKELKLKLDMSMSLGWIGEIFRLKGDLDRALDNLKQSLTLREETGPKETIAWNLLVIGMVYHGKGEFEFAQKHLERSLKILEETGSKIRMAYALRSLVSVAIDKGSPEQAQNYLRYLKQLQDQEKTRSISQLYRISKAIILKTSPRIRKKAKAEELLKKVAEEQVSDHELTVDAMCHLCELLLYELKAFGEPEVLEEAKILTQELSKIAQQQHSFSLRINTLILQAKFFMLDGDLTIAMDLLNEARTTAEGKGLVLLSEKISKEQENLENELNQWSELVERNAPIKERIEQARLEEHISQAIKARDDYSMNRPQWKKYLQERPANFDRELYISDHNIAPRLRDEIQKTFSKRKKNSDE